MEYSSECHVDMRSVGFHIAKNILAKKLLRMLLLSAFTLVSFFGYSQTEEPDSSDFAIDDTTEFLLDDTEFLLDDVTLLDSAENAMQQEFWIAQSWVEMRNYAKAYESLSKIYAENPYDARSTKLFYDVSQWLNRKSPVRQYHTPKTLLVEGAWSHEANKIHKEVQCSSSNYYDAGEYWEVRGAFSHDVGSICRFKHTVEFQNSPYTSYFDVLSVEESAEMDEWMYDEKVETMQRQFAVNVKNRRWKYGLESSFSLPKNFTISAFGRFIMMNRTLPHYVLDTTAADIDASEDGEDWFLKKESSEYRNEDRSDFDSDGNNEVNPQSKYTAEVEEITKPYYLVGLSLRKTYKQFDFSFRTSYLHYWNYNIAQFGLSFLWMPMGNLDFYLKTKVAALLRQDNSTSSNAFIRTNSNKSENFPVIEEIIGVKTARFLWLEASFLIGNQKGYEDFDANFISLSPENTKYRASLSAYFVVSEKLRFNLTYRMTRRVSTTVNVSDNDFYEVQDDVSDHLLSMGIKWNF